MYFPLAIFLMFQEPAASAGAPVLADCSDSGSILTALKWDDAVQVLSSRADGAHTCYGISTISDGKPVRGYVLDASLKAIREYDAKRFHVAVPLPPPPERKPPATAENPVTVSAPRQPSGPPFANFVAIDVKNKRVSIKDIHAKATLVCFWTPYNERSQLEFLQVMGLANRYKKQGLQTVAVVLSGDLDKINSDLEDFEGTMPSIPNVPNGTEIAARYGVTPGMVPRTFVLNEHHEIIASSLHGNALEKAVRQLLDLK